MTVFPILYAHEVFLRALREAGPGASDHEVAQKTTQYVEALSDSDRA